MTSLSLKIPPLLLTVVLMVAMAALARFTPGIELLPLLRIGLAGALGALGVAVAALGVASFRRAATTVNPIDPGATTALVDQGVYRVSRNPMYLGFLLVLLGWGIWLESPAALALALGFVPYMNRYQIIPEERSLEARFGDAYARYRESVRRWI